MGHGRGGIGVWGVVWVRVRVSANSRRPSNDHAHDHMHTRRWPQLHTRGANNDHMHKDLTTSAHTTNRPRAHTRRTGHERTHDEPATRHTRRTGHERTHDEPATSRHTTYMCTCVNMCMHAHARVHICLCEANKTNK